MTTTIQILLVIVVTILTITLAVIGIQIIFLLQEIRKNVEKIGPILDNVATEQSYINGILENAKTTSDKVSQTVGYFQENVAMPAAGAFSLLKNLKQLFGDKKGK